MVPEFPLSYRIRLAVELANIDIDVLAEALDVHPNTVHNYMAGRSKPKLPAIKTIAEMCRVSPEWMATGRVSDTNQFPQGKQWLLDLFDENTLLAAPEAWQPIPAAA